MNIHLNKYANKNTHAQANNDIDIEPKTETGLQSANDNDSR